MYSQPRLRPCRVTAESRHFVGKRRFKLGTSLGTLKTQERKTTEWKTREDTAANM